MVIRSCGIRIACNQLAAADVAGNAKGILFSYHLAVRVEDKLHQAAVFFHLMAQALGVVAVHLDVSVKSLHLDGAVEGIVAVPGLIVRQQVACMVIAEEGSGTVFGVGRQAVAGVVLVELLCAGCHSASAVACFVVEQFFSIGGILHLLQLVQRVVVVECLTSKLLFVGTVAVSVVEVAVIGQDGVAGLDKKSDQVLVLVVLVLFEHRAVLLLADGTVGVILVGRQLVPIIPNFLGQVKDRVGILCHLASDVNLLDLVAVVVVGHGEQGAAAG